MARGDMSSTGVTSNDMVVGGKRAVDDAAVAWFVRLHDEDATEADRLALAHWRDADPAHEAAWQELEAVWTGLDQVPVRRPAPVAPARGAALRIALPGWRGLAVAAMLFLAVGIGWRLMPTGFWADHRTGLGERLTVRLEDGSQVELGTASALDVDFSGARRSVRLLAGQAFFTVAAEPGRPFVVEAGEGQVRALGTAFDVKIGGRVAVAVTQHAVEVRAAEGASVRVPEGAGVDYDGEGVSGVAAVDLDTVQAWRHDQIVFHDAPLDQVLAELGRYRRGHVQLLGGDLGKRRVTAVFDTRRPDEAIDTIAATLGLRVLRATNLLVALVPR